MSISRMVEITLPVYIKEPQVEWEDGATEIAPPAWWPQVREPGRYEIDLDCLEDMLLGDCTSLPEGVRARLGWRIEDGCLVAEVADAWPEHTWSDEERAKRARWARNRAL